MVELLVVIGIIALLLALLMPTLNRAQQYSRFVACQSNLRQVGQMMIMYANDSGGWLFPPDDGDNGSAVSIDQRWFVFVLKPHRPRDPYDLNIADWTPPIMRCPSDIPEPGNDNSYCLNHHLVEHDIRYSTKPPAGIAPSRVVVMGEKKSAETDYYVQNYANQDPPSSYDNEVELYRHGTKLGSNYLYLDLHVDDHGPVESTPGQNPDPWDFPSLPPTTEPGQ